MIRALVGAGPASECQSVIPPMSAAFEIDGKTFWGSNSAVEAYVAAIAAQSTARLGPDHALTIFFRSERESFYEGWIVFLDKVATNPGMRASLVAGNVPLSAKLFAQVLNDAKAAIEPSGSAAT